MPSITLQFVREARITSSLIAWFSAGTVSHVDACVPAGLLGAFEREVGHFPSGVLVRPVGYIALAAQVKITVPVSDIQQSRWLEFLGAQVGKPYDWSVIAGFATGRNWRERDSWICSELQAAALEAAGIVPRLFLAANKITPVALALLLSALPGASIKTLK